MRYLFTMLLAAALTAASAGAESLPDWFVPLRDAVYEQRLDTGAISALYRQAVSGAKAELTGAALNVMLARCECLIGRVLQIAERKKEAAAHFDEGMRLAEEAINERESAGAWAALGENLSQNCTVRGSIYAIGHGLDVEKYAKKALALDKRNAPAQYMLAARWVYAPPPFGNIKKGIEMMEAILTEADLGKDDRFNVYSSIGYAYSKQKKTAEAREWLLKSLEVYPSNQFARDLLEGRKSKYEIVPEE